MSEFWIIHVETNRDFQMNEYNDINDISAEASEGKAIE